MAVQSDSLSGAASAVIWLSAGSVAIALHLVLVQQGVAALRFSTSSPPPPKTLEIDISSVPRGVAARREVNTPKASAAVRPDVVKPVDQNKAVSAASVAATPIAPAARISGSTQTGTTATSLKAASVPVVPSTRASTQKALEAAPAPLPPKRAGVRPPQSVAASSNSGSVVVVTPVPNAPNSIAATKVATAVDTASSQPVSSTTGKVRVAASAPVVASVTPVAKSNPSIAKVAAVQPNATPSLPPVATVVEQEGLAAPEIPIIAATQQDAVAYQSVLDILATTPSGTCFAALPTLSDTGEFQLEVFSRTNEDIESFSKSFGDRTGEVPNTNLKQVSEAQCAALTFLRDSPLYPRFKLYFEIARRDILSGQSLEGRIGNTGGGFLTLLVVDDEGKVQDLASYLQFVPGAAQFSIALSVTGSPVETQQLLVALSTRGSLTTVQDYNGAAASDFFQQLTAELREKGEIEDAAVVAFTVR